MRAINIYLTVLISAMGIGEMYAQNCPQEVSTDPRNPINPERPSLANQFFWFPHNENLNANFELITPGGTYPFITSPYWAESTLSSFQLFGQQDSDFYPEDGWELLKVNFGRLNNGTQRTALPSMPYMTLYNKYTGTMRFMGMWPNASNSWQIIRFRVSLPSYKFGGDPNSSLSKLNASNLFSIQGNAAQPLDQETDENVYEIITEYPGISNASFFFWFDLPVAYDPCVCYNDVAIQFEASVENSWDVTIRGVLDAQIIQQGVPTPQNHSALVAKRVIAAAGATATAIATSGAVVQTGPLLGLLDIFRQRPGISSQAQSNLQLLQQSMTSASSIVYDQTKNEWRNTVTGDKMGNSDWDKLFAGVGSFLNAGVDYLNPSAKASAPRTSVVGSITASGNATLNVPTGDLIYWGVPGSDWTNDLGETVANTSSGLNPEYPMYNNPLGVFSLLTTPKITLTPYNLLYCYGFEEQGPGQDPLRVDDFRRRVHFHFEEDLNYYLNPALNLDYNKTEILASIVLKNTNSGVNFSGFPDCYEIGGEILLTPSEAEDVLTTFNLNKGSDPSERFTSPVPLRYLREIVGKLPIDASTSLSVPFDFYIRFILKLVSNDIGRNGQQNSNTYVISFPVEKIWGNSPIPVPIIDIVSDPVLDNSYSNPTVLTSGTSAFSDSYVEISSTITSSSYMPDFPATILSSSVIALKPGAQLSGALRLAIDYPFQGLFPQEQFDATLLGSYCENQLAGLTYQANEFSAKAALLQPPSFELLEPYLTKDYKSVVTFSLSPNPASAFLTLSATQPIVRAEIYDLSGRMLVQEYYGDGGGSQVQLNLSALSNGVYVVRATAGGQVFTERLVVSK